MRAEEAVVGLLGGGLRCGEVRQSGPLSVVGLFHDGAAVPYRLFAAAAAAGLVEVEEVGAGSVPELRVVNRAAEPVLLVEGEVLGGLKQTRTLNTTVLVPAGATLVIPVSCVEAHRWGAPSPMAREDVHASPAVRVFKNLGVRKHVRMGVGYRSDQGEVWGAVDRHLAAHRVESPSASYAEVQRQRSGDLGDIAGRLQPEPGQRGVLALAGGRPLALDVFDRPETLAVLWAGLVGSYAADALVAAGGAGPGVAPAGEWLAGLARGEASTHAAVGLGEVVFLSSPAAVVSALVVDAAVVHLAGLWAPGATAEEPRRPAGARRAWFGESQ